ncbi:putative baseplate assembly protein [Phytohabitans suffuscus]|uniref:Putative baseplate assembly protein n=1 Tax=Phytohabitans suffuscus TaxID=624315 RepID=A0A6F8YR93_9ACTN|nr:putative baseplate assembly protein [Phytohabitans suffuscus]BCB88715.1 putative baseplate assembly protein [Phytohabitans suffuscus]
MALPAPDLDDRRFQDLVDDAKRLVQRRCPEWTDHNVSDPGVTLIESFAFMTEQLLYRLNRVPDRLYIKFLELIGVRLLPPSAARTPVTFWLSAPAGTTLVVDAGTSVGTVRTETQESVVFSTVEDLPLPPCALRHAVTSATETAAADGAGATGVAEAVDRDAELATGAPFPAFAEQPRTGDVLLLGLTAAVPNCAVQFDFQGEVEGIGVDPRDPPLVWEAWTGDGWSTCEVTDETGGLNRSGPVVVHVPAGHQTRIVEGRRAGWLRARVVAARPGQPAYSASPLVRGLSAGTVGGTVEAVHAEIVGDEVLGEAEGVSGQRFTVSRVPVLHRPGFAVLEVGTDDGWQEWTQVDNFAASGPDDRHFQLEPATGEVRFGPLVREPGNRVRRYGATPPPGAAVRMRRYLVGGGRTGNVARGALRTLKSSIPYVADVENRFPAQGGVDGETIEEAKERGPIVLRSRGRAVTAEDYEVIAREAAPDLARVRCLTAGEAGTAPGAIRVLVVPGAPVERGRVELEDLLPDTGMLHRVADRLDEVRLIGTRVLVEPPRYQGVTVVARLVARPRLDRTRVERDALDALYGFLNPLTGGPEGTGWAFGRPVHVGELFGVLQGVGGVDVVEDLRLFGANPVTGERGAQATRLELDAQSLVFSFDHRVRVEQGGRA